MKEDVKHVAAPVIIVPYVWIGDFVRCHSVVKLLRAKNPDRPIDIVSSTLCAPLADYMPGVRRAIVVDLPRGQLGLRLQRKLARLLQEEQYGQAIVMSRKWKAALAPWLAGIPMRTGFAGEFRFGLLNDVRPRRKQTATHDRSDGSIGAAEGCADPGRLAAARIESTRPGNRQLDSRSAGLPKKSIPSSPCRQAPWVPARHGLLGTTQNSRVRLPRTASRSGCWAGRVKLPSQRKSWPLAGTVCGTSPAPICATRSLRSPPPMSSVTNDSGLMHVSAAIGTPTIAIFGPTSPWHWKPLNPLAAVLEPPGDEHARERARIEGNNAVRHRRTDDVSVETVLTTVRQVLAKAKNPSI